MFCPRCSQEKVSDDLRFCSSCGLPLDLVSEVVESGGTPEFLRETEKSKTVLTRRNGLLASCLWFSVFMIFLALLLFIDGGTDDLIAVVGMLGFFGSAIIVIISRFLKKRPRGHREILQTERHAGQSRFTVKQSAKELGSAETIPASDYVSPIENTKSYETGKMARVPSVTEETTKLLKKKR